MILFYGKSSSGKSEAAESCACSIRDRSKSELFYVATMETQSESAKERIQRHRRLRADKGFKTIEEMYNVSKLSSRVENQVVLLECLSNLVANVLFKNTNGRIPSKDEVYAIALEIAEDIILLDKASLQLIVVSNNIFSYPINDEWCCSYMLCLSLINRHLANYSESVIEVEAGVNNYIKGVVYCQ